MNARTLRLLAAVLARLRWAAAIGAVLSLASCDRNEIVAWSEEVKLQSGELIVISRTAAFSENWIAGGGGGAFNMGMTLRIQNPQHAENPSVWEGRFVPILLDRDPQSKEWFVVATFFHCDSWYELGRPKLPYTEYRFKNGQWVQQALSPQWVGREGNVWPSDLADRQAITQSKPVLTLERKRRMQVDRPAMSPEYKRVVDKWSSGC